MPSTQDIFETIYRDRLWGGRKRFWQRFYSGSGSAGKHVVGPYINALLPHVTGKKVVDIGCGDFTIGSNLAPFATHYLACDIARPLIEHNRKRFAGVEFRVLDAIEEPLPEGEVILVRQVFQHLDNASISKILGKLSKYPAAIITEHVPAHEFIPNIDMPTGAGNRMAIGSGIVLSAAPFNFPSGEVICEVPQHGGLIQTRLFALGADH